MWCPLIQIQYLFQDSCIMDYITRPIYTTSIFSLRISLTTLDLKSWITNRAVKQGAFRLRKKQIKSFLRIKYPTSEVLSPSRLIGFMAFYLLIIGLNITGHWRQVDVNRYNMANFAFSCQNAMWRCPKLSWLYGSQFAIFCSTSFVSRASLLQLALKCWFSVFL